MRIIRRVVLAAGMAGIAFSMHAQTYTTTPNQSQPVPTAPPEESREPQPEPVDLYHDSEVSFDGFGIGALHEYDFDNGARARRDLRWGGGGGVNLFFARYVGVGGDFYSTSVHHSFVDTTTGNLILRFPIATTGIAPYIFGGAGYQFQGIDQIVAGGGVGLEIRLAPHFSIFADARYLAAAKTDDYGVGRAGIRISF
jgi:hypothetical protein